MKPHEKLLKYREILELSREQFAKLFSSTVRIIDNCERGKQKIPDELALLLEITTKVPFKYWKLGLSETELHPVKKANIEEIINYGSRFPLIAEKYNLTENTIAYELDITVREYQNIVATSPLPVAKSFINKFINRFSQEDLALLFYNISVNAELSDNDMQVEISDKFNNDSVFSSDEVREIKNILKILKSQSVDLLKDKVLLSSKDD